MTTYIKTVEERVLVTDAQGTGLMPSRSPAFQSSWKLLQNCAHKYHKEIIRSRSRRMTIKAASPPYTLPGK